MKPLAQVGEHLADALPPLFPVHVFLMVWSFVWQGRQSMPQYSGWSHGASQPFALLPSTSTNPLAHVGEQLSEASPPLFPLQAFALVPSFVSQDLQSLPQFAGWSHAASQPFALSPSTSAKPRAQVGEQVVEAGPPPPVHTFAAVPALVRQGWQSKPQWLAS